MLNDIDYISPIIIKNVHLKQQSVIEKDNIIYDLVNKISGVAYKINNQVLDFILERGLEFNLYTDPKFKHPLLKKKESSQNLKSVEKRNLSRPVRETGSRTG